MSNMILNLKNQTLTQFWNEDTISDKGEVITVTETRIYPMNNHFERLRLFKIYREMAFYKNRSKTDTFTLIK